MLPCKKMIISTACLILLSYFLFYPLVTEAIESGGSEEERALEYANKVVEEATQKAADIEELFKILERLPPELVNESYSSPQAQKMVIEALQNDADLSLEQKEKTIRSYQEFVGSMNDAFAKEDTRAIDQETHKRKSFYVEYALDLVNSIAMECANYYRENGSYPENSQMIIEMPGVRRSLAEDSDTLKSFVAEKPIGGYRILYKLVDKNHYEITVQPILPGLKTFFMDETRVLKYNDKMGQVVDLQKLGEELGSWSVLPP